MLQVGLQRQVASTFHEPGRACWSRWVLEGEGAAGLKRPERTNWLSGHFPLCIAVTLHGFISDIYFLRQNARNGCQRTVNLKVGGRRPCPKVPIKRGPAVGAVLERATRQQRRFLSLCVSPSTPTNDLHTHHGTAASCPSSIRVHSCCLRSGATPSTCRHHHAAHPHPTNPRNNEQNTEE
jgi:hypothetical protein